MKNILAAHKENILNEKPAHKLNNTKLNKFNV